MLNKEFKVLTGRTIRYEFLVENSEYLEKFGGKFSWYIDVMVFDDPKAGVSRCEAFYSVDGSRRNYYLKEFYIPCVEDINAYVENGLADAMDTIDWEKMIREIEQDAEECWEGVNA